MQLARKAPLVVRKIWWQIVEVWQQSAIVNEVIKLGSSGTISTVTDGVIDRDWNPGLKSARVLSRGLGEPCSLRGTSSL